MRVFSTILTTVACFSALPAAATAVQDCTDIARAEYLMEPWEETTRLFLNGKVRLAVLDTIEPAGAPFHLIVLSPPFNEIGDRQCKMISLQEGVGFAGVRFGDLTADYMPTKGFRFALPVGLYEVETGTTSFVPLLIDLNPTTGVLSANVVDDAQ